MQVSRQSVGNTELTLIYPPSVRYQRIEPLSCSLPPIERGRWCGRREEYSATLQSRTGPRPENFLPIYARSQIAGEGQEQQTSQHAVLLVQSAITGFRAAAMSNSSIVRAKPVELLE